ncbi:hypothetical protein [Parendozoicomonas sp. Alg238-R29]|uniref:hypothetical protein n=1 Tax=Parendozoicomonas sp. Alg238-R29 TaxID=2993446 RepID=UPI00248D90B5|nr:hypothetical protein [Parendozoicomonas sp. Alg238-R29]
MLEKYELVFSGETTPGAPLEKVRANAAKLFHAGPAQLEKLFSGSPVVLKNNLDKATAESYLTKLKSAGLVCSLRAMQQKPAPQPASPKTKSKEPAPKLSPKAKPEEGSLSIAPVGADVNPHEEIPVPPMPDTNHFSLKEQKGYLFDQDDTPPPPPPNTNHITLE